MEDSAKSRALSLKLVVMISGEMDGVPFVGAGIVFGRGPDKAYVVTANHVVRRGTTEARNVQVRFSDAKNRPLVARLLTTFDAGSDVAVLSVENLSKSGVNSCSWDFSRLNFPRMSKTTGKLKRGDPVYAVGNPNGSGWAISVNQENVAQVEAEKIFFQSTFISGGHSGGGLLDGQGCLQGMLQGEEPPYGVAKTIDSIIGKLKDWGYFVELFRPHRSQKGEEYNSLLEMASAEGLTTIVQRTLVGCPTAVNIREGFTARTALSLASSKGHLQAMTTLIAAGASLETEDIYGTRPLHAAAANGQLEALELLLAHGANLNAADARKQTPLHKAVTGKHLDVARALLRAGADLDAKNDRGQTAVEVAADPAMRALLLAHGVKR